MASTAPLPTAQAARAERDAHAFSLKSGQPTPLKLARLHRAFELMLAAPQRATSGERSWVEGALALRLALISGRALEEVHALQILPIVKAPHPGWPAPRLVQVRGYAPALWLEAGVAPHVTAYELESGCVGQASHAVWLALDPLSESWLRQVHWRPQLTRAKPEAVAGRPLFSKTLPDLEKAVEDFRGRATRAMGSSESDYLPKLEDCTRFLRRQLAVSHPGDPAVSWLITKTVPTRNATTSYYSSVSLRAAQCYQAAAVAEAANRAANVGSSVPPEPDLPAMLADRVIGSRFCPSEKALAGLRERLLVKARISRGAMTAKRASEVDHAFTAYAWLFFSLHSGWRPPDRLLPDPDDLDWATGMFFLEDKPVHSSTAPTDPAGDEAGLELPAELESEDVIRLPAAVNGFAKSAGGTAAGTRRRWLPLGKRVMAQLRAYHVHVKARDGRQLAAEPLKDRAAVLKYLGEVPGLGWDLPRNFPRHYLRSALVGRTSVEVINAYLGHWETGAEPWWNGSCLDPVAYAHDARAAIDAVFPESDWPVLAGFR